MDKFSLIKDEIRKIIDNSEISTDPRHSIDTHKWLMELCPDASEELQIAALGHDIERGVNPRVGKKAFNSYEEYKEEHVKRSSEIICKVMEKVGYPEKSIEKVKNLVLKHEVGGDKESDYLRDADSICYFEYGVEAYLKRKGDERTKFKINYMYSRVSDKAKEIIKGLNYSSEVKKVFDEVVKY